MTEEELTAIEHALALAPDDAPAALLLNDLRVLVAEVRRQKEWADRLLLENGNANGQLLQARAVVDGLRVDLSRSERAHAADSEAWVAERGEHLARIAELERTLRQLEQGGIENAYRIAAVEAERNRSRVAASELYEAVLQIASAMDSSIGVLTSAAVIRRIAQRALARAQEETPP